MKPIRLLSILISTILIFNSCTGKNKAVVTHIPVGVESIKNDVLTYHVGDYYPEPHNAGNAIGVVFWLDPDTDGKAGKIVSLDEVNMPWSNEWVVTNATHIDSGVYNMLAITKMTDWQKKYPGFNWCTDKAAETGQPWYLPAKNELKALYAGFNGKVYEDITGWNDYVIMPDCTNDNCREARVVFNEKLEKAGGAALNTAGAYWSSSELYSYKAFFMFFSDGLTYPVDESVAWGVRPIMAFGATKAE